MSVPAFLKSVAGGAQLAVKLTPRSSRDEIGEPLGNELRVKVTAPPVDAAANEALVRLLAGSLGCPRGAVRLIRGHTSRHKIIQVTGLTAEAVSARLQS